MKYDDPPPCQTSTGQSEPSCPPPYQEAPPRRDVSPGAVWTVPTLNIPQPYLPQPHLGHFAPNQCCGYAPSDQPPPVLPPIQGYAHTTSGQTSSVLPPNQGYVHATSDQTSSVLPPNQGYDHATSGQTPTVLPTNQGYARSSAVQTHAVLPTNTEYTVDTSGQTHTVLPPNQGYAHTSSDQRPAVLTHDEGHAQAASVTVLPAPHVRFLALHVPPVSSVISCFGQFTHFSAVNDPKENHQYPVGTCSTIPVMIPNFPNTRSGLHLPNTAHAATNTSDPGTPLARTRMISASTSTRELLLPQVKVKVEQGGRRRRKTLIGCVLLMNLAVLTFVTVVMLHVNGVIDLDAAFLNKLNKMIIDLGAK